MLEDMVVFVLLLVETEAVLEARAAAARHRDAQHQAVIALQPTQDEDPVGGTVGNGDGPRADARGGCGIGRGSIQRHISHGKLLSSNRVRPGNRSLDEIRTPYVSRPDCPFKGATAREGNKSRWSLKRVPVYR